MGSPFSVGATCSVEHRHASDIRRSTPGVLAPVQVILSWSIITYSTPSAPLAGTSRFRRIAAYTRYLRCAGAPRRPASGSGLSLRIPSWHAVLHRPRGLQHRQFQAAMLTWPSPRDQRLGIPKSPQSVSREETISGLPSSHIRYGLPVCSPPCTDPTQFPGRRGLLLPGFRRVGHPSRRWI
jgi:hypothetical protein